MAIISEVEEQSAVDRASTPVVDKEAGVNGKTTDAAKDEEKKIALGMFVQSFQFYQILLIMMIIDYA